MSANRVVLGGRLLCDPYLHKAGTVAAVLLATIEVDGTFRCGDEVIEELVLVEVKVYGKAGEAFVRHHRRGDPVHLTGALRFDQWEDLSTGEPRSKLYVVANEWEFVKPKPESDAAGEVHDAGGSAW